MAALHKSAAALRIFGDALDPDEISELLGSQPSNAYRKGQAVRGSSTGREFVKKAGSWHLEAEDQEPGALDQQICSIFNKLSCDLVIWMNITHRYKVDLFCGFFMEETDEGLEISPDSLRTLSDRSIILTICLYAPTMPEI